MDDELDALLDDAFGDYKAASNEEPLRRLKEQELTDARCVKGVQAGPLASSSSAASSSATIPTPVVALGDQEPDDVLDAALQDFVAEQQRPHPHPSTTSLPAMGDDFDGMDEAALRQTIGIFTNALESFGEGSDDPQLAALSRTLKDFMAQVEATDNGGDLRVEKVMGTLSSLRDFVDDDPDLLRALDAVQAELLAGPRPDEQASSIPRDPTALDTPAPHSTLEVPGDALEPPAEGEREQAGADEVAAFSKLISVMMSPALLLPAFQRLRAVYPAWLEQHGAAQPADERERYTRQFAKVTEICDECERLVLTGAAAGAEAGAEDDAAATGGLWASIEELQMYGKPPPEVLAAL